MPKPVHLSVREFVDRMTLGYASVAIMQWALYRRWQG